MYYPYFRGKQYELIAIREMAETMATSGFCPIIEPVRASVSGLQRTLAAVMEAGGSAIVIVNPQFGDFQGDHRTLADLVQVDLDPERISAGVLLTASTTLESALRHRDANTSYRPTFIHFGFLSAKALIAEEGAPTKERAHVFLDDSSTGRLYRRHFREFTRVLLRDGFRKVKNADYRDSQREPFSDLHATFGEEGMEGFGDFLVVGNTYTEGGGPAYAVAIHLTQKWGIHLTQVAPRCSIRRCGGLPARSGRIRGPLRHRGRVSRLPDAVALARRLSLSGLRP